MEKELCRKTFKESTKKYLVWFIICMMWIVVAVVANLITYFSVIATVASPEYAFRLYQGPYWAGWGNAILGLLLAILFFILWLSSKEVNIVLTNKRIIMSLKKKKLFAGNMYLEENIVLSHIISFELFKYEKNNTQYLSFSTSKRNYNFVVSNSEFYDKYVELLKEYN